jgi:hypothetical protein
VFGSAQAIVTGQVFAEHWLTCDRHAASCAQQQQQLIHFLMSLQVASCKAGGTAELYLSFGHLPQQCGALAAVAGLLQ